MGAESGRLFPPSPGSFTTARSAVLELAVAGRPLSIGSGSGSEEGSGGSVRMSGEAVKRLRFSPGGPVRFSHRRVSTSAVAGRLVLGRSVSGGEESRKVPVWRG